MTTKRLIDATPLDKLIIEIPQDVGDEYSYIRGVEDVLELVHKAKTENEWVINTPSEEVLEALQYE